MDLLKILVPVLVVLVGSAISLWLYQRKRKDDLGDRGDDKTDLSERDRMSYEWELNKPNHDLAHQVLNDVDRFCAAVRDTPGTAATLADLGVQRLMADLGHVSRKMPDGGQEHLTFERLLGHITQIKGKPLPVDRRAEHCVVAEAACTQGREATSALGLILGARRQVTALWGPPGL